MHECTLTAAPPPVANAAPISESVPSPYRVGSMAANPLGDSILGFSVELYNQLLTENGYTGNTFYSPFSISAALAMALAGAKNDTAKQIAAVLRVDGQEIHQHFSNFLCKLGGYAPDVKLHVANRMYLEKRFRFFRATFLFCKVTTILL